MFRHTFPIGRIFGIEIDIDYSWFLILVLLTWILAASYFPAEFRNWTVSEYWLMGFVTSIMLFVSVLIHELGHSLVARHFGVSVPRITLFIFGGVSEMAAEPPSAVPEFWIAIVGPLTSFALALLLWEIEPLVAAVPPAFALVVYLALINLVLGLFNLIPGFPLDGGRVLRAIVWRITGKFQKATRAAAFAGRMFGFLLILVGVWQVLTGSLLNGLWIAFIGWFLESAAVSQLRVATLKSVLGEHTVLDAMKRDIPAVPASTTLQELVDRYVLTRGDRSFIVDGSGTHSGIVTLSAIRQVPRAAWPTTPAFETMTSIQKLHHTRSDLALFSALEQMQREDVDQLPVVDGNNSIVGVLSREDILHYLKLLQALST